MALFCFAPATVEYGRSYLHSSSVPATEANLLILGASWPAEMTDGMTAEQLAVLQPPYAKRLDRPLLARDYAREGGEGGIAYRSRNDRGKAHDRDVFKTAYL
eukprot:COSAG02_NODE_330_length_24501_cov_39.465850_22_plen_102_part_00